MDITIKDTNITLKYSFRGMMIYEKIAGTSFQPKGISEILIYFYSTILASDRNITITYDEFIDWLDENPNKLTEFSKWLNEVLTKNAYINQADESSDSEKKI